MKISVIGGGSWGTALARLISENGHAVSLWVYEPDCARAIQTKRINPYLPDILLPASLKATACMEEALAGTVFLLFAVPSHATRAVLTQASAFLSPDIPIVSATKGIEKKSLMLIGQVILDVLEYHNPQSIAFLSGPSFSREVALGMPTAVVIAAQDPALAKQAQAVLSRPTFSVTQTQDVLGVQLAGAVKNVIALAVGCADGMGWGNNARARIITTGLSEMVRLGAAMGAQPDTFYGLAGVGDLCLTCGSDLSRNLRSGRHLAAGGPLTALSNMTVEGIESTAPVYGLAKREGVRMPIVEAMYDVLNNGVSVAEALGKVLNAPL